MKKKNKNESRVEDRIPEIISRIVAIFVRQEFRGFKEWMKEQWESNPQAVLAVNPPNHTFDLEDGSLDLTLGEDQVRNKLQHHKAVRGTYFAYAIKAKGKLRKVLQSVRELSTDEQLEAAMAALLEYRKGSFVCNTTEWYCAAAVLDDKSEGLNNLFYRGVCEEIVKLFRNEGWLK